MKMEFNRKELIKGSKAIQRQILFQNLEDMRVKIDGFYSEKEMPDPNKALIQNIKITEINGKPIMNKNIVDIDHILVNMERDLKKYLKDNDNIIFEGIVYSYIDGKRDGERKLGDKKYSVDLLRLERYGEVLLVDGKLIKLDKI